MVDQIQQWLEQIVPMSQRLEEFMLAKEPDDSFGWGKMLEMMWTAQLPEERPGGLLLTGPNGCGKHTAMAHMILQLRQEGFGTVFLDGMDMEDWDGKTAKERINKLLDHFDENGQGLCMVLENVESCGFRRELLTHLGHTLQMYRLYRDQVQPLFLILIDQKEQQIPPALRGELRLCRMCLPDQQHRKKYLEKNAGNIAGYVSLDVIAAETEGVTYAQLADLMYNVQYLVDCRDGYLDEGEMRTFLAQQLPQPSREKKLDTLLGAAKKFMEEMPQMLQNAVASMPVGVPVAESTVASVPQPSLDAITSPEDLGSRREQIENMPVDQLQLETFGQEFVNQMMKAAQVLSIPQ